MIPRTTDLQKIGIGLSLFGISFLFLGIILMFDKSLLALGNILFLSGLFLLTGFERSARFFFQKHKIKAKTIFVFGILIVLIGWPVVGMLLEIYGFIKLFSGFIPVLISFIVRLPVISYILYLPGVRQVVNKITESQSMV